MWHIYVIENKVNGKHYTGITNQIPPTNRWSKQHRPQLIKGNHKNSHLQSAWSKYGENAFEFCVIADNLTLVEAGYEEELIRQWYASIGLSYNQKPGGSGKPLTKEIRDKISRANKGRTGARVGHPVSKETRKKIGESNKGRKPSIRCIENSVKARKGRPLSADRRDRISSFHTGRKRTQETRRKISDNAKTRYKQVENHPMYGKPVSEETRKRIGDTHRGKVVSEETRRRISEARKGVPWTNARRKAQDKKTASGLSLCE
jgi:predicted GIY-YIG superfamily endonuclease